MNVGSWLVALGAPLIRKILVSLGVGVITYTGMQSIVSNVLSSAKAAWYGFPVDILALVNLAGVGTAFSIIAGAFTARLSLSLLQRFGVVS